MKHRYVGIILLAIFTITIGCAENTLFTLFGGDTEPVITEPPEEVWQATEVMRAEQGIDLTTQKAFYTKYIDAAGIAILANAAVADAHLIEARQVILLLTAKRPELREMLATQKPKDVSSIAAAGEGITLFGQGFYMILIDKVSFWDMPEIDFHFYGSGSCHIRGSRQNRQPRFLLCPRKSPPKTRG